MITKNAKILILVASLGYFVDVYDLILFGVIRTPSLKSIGITDPKAILDAGLNLFNIQMAGMLLGGIFWGVLGDKMGRKSVLFGSIMMYSIANLLNGLVADTSIMSALTQYGILRFIAGIGLAGELGAGVTMVNETLPTSKRGYGAVIIAGVGTLGAVMAALVGGYSDDPEWWRNTYFIGGGMGMLLLFLRIGTFESNIYQNVESHVSKGDFFSLFTNFKRFKKYVYCILIGLPVWYIIGILILASPEFAEILGVQGEKITAGKTIMFNYIGLSLGDVFSGIFSQYIKSRKKVIYIFTLVGLFVAYFYLYMSTGISSDSFYFLCSILGFCAGYWAVFMTVSSEQFGTNLRSTVTTTVPNFVRGALIPLTLFFKYLKDQYGMIDAAFYIGVFCCVIAILAATRLEESFHKDLDYTE
ncbi:MAG: MFS transporter [Pseudarcicella sp.]|nr:MFS transporter [Pseudarcicella sp.]MBP6409559.1 MFS transporter [Pseudarcicella sp.]